MRQLHDKGLVEIIPEDPIRYKPVPLEKFLERRIEELTRRAQEIQTAKQNIAHEFAVLQKRIPERQGRFEVVYGRRNVRDRLNRMYDGAKKELVSIGTSYSPERIARTRLFVLEEKKRAGVRIRYAFPLREQHSIRLPILQKFAEIHLIEQEFPVFWVVVDDREAILNHPIPNDENPVRGDDVALYTDDQAVVKALKEVANEIWEDGDPVDKVSLTAPLLRSMKRYFDTLGIPADRLTGAMGAAVGREIAGRFKAKDRDGLLREIQVFWEKNGLGKITVVQKSPLTLQVDNFIEVMNVPTVGEAFCHFMDRALNEIFEKRLGKSVQVVEVGCTGEDATTCRMVLKL